MVTLTEHLGNRTSRFRKTPVRDVGLAVAAGVAVGLVVAVGQPIYAAAGLVGLAVGIAMFLDVRVGLVTFVLVATLLPFAVIPIPLGTFKLTLLDVTLSTLLLVWILRLLADRRQRFWSTGADLPVALFLALATVCFILGTAYVTTSSDVRLFAKMINSVLLFFTVANCVRRRSEARRLLAVLILSGALGGALGVIFYVVPSSLTVRVLGALGRIGYPTAASDILQYIASTNIQRATGTSINPNIFGAMLMICGAITIIQLFARSPVLPRWALAAAFVPLIVALLLSYSRGSLIGMVAGIGVVAALRYRRLLSLMIIVGVAAIFIGLATHTQFFEHLQSGIQVKDQAAAMRLGEYKDALHLIEEFPVLGVGFGQAPNVSLYVGVSSIYLLIAEEMGIVGLLAFLWAIGQPVWKALSWTVTGDDDSVGLVASCAAALVAILVAGLFDHHFVDIQFPHVVALVWFIAGLAMVGIRLGKGEALEEDGELDAAGETAPSWQSSLLRS